MAANPLSEQSFLSQMEKIPEVVERAQLIALEKAAILLVADCKEEVGTYQRANMGHLPPWDELAISTKQDRLARGFSENEPGLRTGEMRALYSSYIEDGSKVIIGNPDVVAKWFEEGTMKQPPRPVIATALFRKEHSITKKIAKKITEIAGLKE
ncbi:hypothetical protein [Acetobacter ascendens]|uniref:Uncharacterized protein n=1 Tax=Acetobacter ascendens TaxID=481146 RepID=A0A1Y0UVP5_9PROT|nr:hypothetical protein [Acetobacter ascendens]ARW09980.1 hypothetical protein S101447_00878 [Acetobacter ascendens]